MHASKGAVIILAHQWVPTSFSKHSASPCEACLYVQTYFWNMLHASVHLITHFFPALLIEGIYFQWRRRFLKIYHIAYRRTKARMMATPNDPASLANTPAGKPPPGVIPNHAHPYTDGPTLVAVGGIFTALALLFVSARIYTKVRLVGKWSPDDSKQRRNSRTFRALMSRSHMYDWCCKR